MIIVTGAAGFIGSNIIADLQAAGRGPIVAVDLFGDSNKWQNLAKHNISAFIKPTQIQDFLQAFSSKIECIIHMGAITDTTEKNADALVDNNLNYSISLWDWCTEHKVPFIYASAAATYGALENMLKDDDDFESLSKLRPVTPYGWSKNATDIIFAQRAAAGKAPPQWVGLKFFNVYGPNEYHKGSMRSMVTKFYDDVQTWDAVQLYKSDRAHIEDGQQKRDFVYVKDCSQIALWFLEHNTVSGIFNVGTGNARSFTELVKAMEKNMGKEIEITFKDMPEDIKTTYPYQTYADMSKARSVGLSFSLRSLEAGIADYMENYLQQPDIYR